MAKAYRKWYAFAMKQSYRKRIYGLIGDNNGLVNIDMAAAVGVPAVELRKLAQRGALERVGRGLYRIPFAPVNKFEQVLIAMSNVGEEAVLVSTSVLALLEIGLEMPPKLLIGTTKRIRKELPPVIKLSSVTPKQTQVIKGVTCQSVFEILSDRARTARKDRVQGELDDALRLGFIDNEEFIQLAAILNEKLQPA